MLVKAKKVTVTAGSFANDMYKRGQVSKTVWAGMKRFGKKKGTEIYSKVREVLHGRIQLGSTCGDEGCC